MLTRIIVCVWNGNGQRVQRMDQLIEKIVKKMQYANLIDDTEVEVYQFGLECLFLKVIHYTSYLLIGISMHMLIPMLVSSIVLMPLRSRAGGYHAKTRIGCYFFSCMVVFFVCLLNQIHLYLWFSISIFLIANVIIWTMSPVEHVNRMLTEKEQQSFRQQARMLLGILDIVIIITGIIESIIYVWLLNGLIIVAVLILLGKVRSNTHEFYEMDED